MNQKKQNRPSGARRCGSSQRSAGPGYASRDFSTQRNVSKSPRLGSTRLRVACLCWSRHRTSTLRNVSKTIGRGFAVRGLSRLRASRPCIATFPKHCAALCRSGRCHALLCLSQPGDSTQRTKHPVARRVVACRGGALRLSAVCGEALLVAAPLCAAFPRNGVFNQ